MSKPMASTEVQPYSDDCGRQFGYVHIEHPDAAALVVHFSAFFGAWGDARAYRDRFQGYFHRLKMLGSHDSHNWLFLCDPYGAHDNGTYYTGERGDFYVERAMDSIISQVADHHGYDLSQSVFAGSSMGATAALKFGIRRGVRGVAAVSPHIDLDICASRQNRHAEVAFVCPDGDPTAVHNHRFTRQIRELVLNHVGTLPRLFLQSCADDHGVHGEQVLPLVDMWRSRGGDVALDERPEGGHTSDFATRSLLVDVIDRLADGREIPLDSYRHDEEFRGEITPTPIVHRMRRRLSPVKAAIIGRGR